MTLFLQHLMRHTGLILPQSGKKVGACIKKEDLKAWINQQDTTVFERLAERASLWRFQHRAARAQLDTLLRTEAKTKKDNNKRLRALEETLWVAGLLEELHLRLNEKRAAEPFRLEQIKLRERLQRYGAKLEPEDMLPEPAHQADAFTDDLERAQQWFTYNFDSTRLFSGHIRRICVGLLAAPEVFGYDYFWANLYAEAMGPVLSLASLWVYLPRTLSNMIILAERCIEENNHIKLESRMIAHCELYDRLFNLVNDSPSVIAAVLASFILSGPSLGLVVYITVWVKVAEVIFASARAYFEAARFDALRDEYPKIKNLTKTDKAYLKHLDACIANEKGRFIACATMHGLLLFCLASFTPPILALNPWVPLVAALCAMIVLGLRFSEFRDVWIPERPSDALDEPSKDRFFQPTQNEPKTCLTSQSAPVSI